MVLVQAILALIFRSAGRLLNTAFGWATMILFGRVRQDRQIYLSAVCFGSVIWLLALVGVAFPAAGTFLLAFVPLPDWVDRRWVRLAMLAAAVVIPAVVGILAQRLGTRRGHGVRGVASAVARGYPYTVGLALTLLLMIVFAPMLKLRDLTRRWSTQHVPVLVEPADYPDVVDELDQALLAGGLPMKRGRPSWMLRAPTRLLAWFAGGAVSDLVADELTRLYAADVAVLLHPSDMVISGRPASASRARAIIAQHLPFTRAYLTWDAEANAIEDALRRVWESVQDGASSDALARLRVLETRMEQLALPYEEWEVLFRQKLQVERSALRRLAGLVEHDARTQDAVHVIADAMTALQRSWRVERNGRGLGIVPFLAATATVAAALVGRRAARRGPDLPAPDAHAEARFTRAA